MAAVTYLIRVLPLTLLRKQIKSNVIRSFLYYVPFVTLAVMTFPAILSSTANLWSGLVAFLLAVALAYAGASLITVSVGACLAVIVLELLM